MSDFTSAFWSLWVAGLTLVSIVACGLLLQSLSRRKVASDPDKTAHAWDEDLEEYNNPLPRWWIGLFWLTIVFSLAYLWFYPGLGSYEGALKWTSAEEHAQEVKVAEDRYGPLYAKFAAVDLHKLSENAEARIVGQKLFLTYCSQCHASDARGAKGFPNLADRDWLGAGDPVYIKKTIMEGRSGMMPAFGAALGDAGVRDAANYVRSLSGLATDPAATTRGKAIFATTCAGCHGVDGKGNPALGAPNLADKTWLYGSSEKVVIETIAKGRSGVMPAHADFLGEQRVHILAAYVYGLSRADANDTLVQVKNPR